MSSSYSIAVVGLWHLGEIYSVGLAELGHHVIGISDDKKLVANFSNNIPPLPEPGLQELLRKNRSEGRLEYSSDFSVISRSNVLWFTFDTPVDDNDDVDLTVIWNALERTLPYIKPDTLVVVTSQVPVGTSEKIKDFIKSARPDIQCGYVYTPENLRLSEAVKCFLDPGRVVVGVERDEDFEKIREIFSPLRAELLRMSVVSAEVGKHALNSFLATSISFANDIADICEVVNADILDVIKVLRTDPRIGPKAFLTAGLGFSGGTLGRDLRVLMPIIKANHIEPSVIEAVFEKNSLRKHLVKNKLSDLFGSLRGKTVSFFGLTYKAGTKTLRRSMAIEIAKECVAAGAIVRLHDPEADIREVKELIDTFFSKDPYETAEGAEAIVVMTPWPVFKELDFSKLAGLTKTSKILFDTTNFLYEYEISIRQAGFAYRGIGR